MNLLRELPTQYLENCPIVDDRYKILFRLGTGRFSKVRMAICLNTSQRVAVKIMNDIHEKQTQDSDVIKYDTKVVKSFLNQIRMCVKSKHRHVVEITDFNIGGTYRTADGQVRRIVYYVMKIANNGQLFRIIKQTELLNQRIARLIFHQLIGGIEKLHSDRISHCDIKAENILIDNKFNVKIADFGCSKYFMDLEHNKIQMDPSQPVGTVKSIAPEVKNYQINGFYHGDQIDLFACGCLLFELVMKSQPFKSSDLKDENYSRLMNKETESFWKLFSKQCNPSVEFKDLIQRLLDPNPKTRINLLQIKKHQWFLGDLPHKNEFKKQMTMRLKKVGAKIRKEQEEEIKQFFKQERSKIELKMLPKVYLTREMEEEMIGLKNQIIHNDNSDSSSGMSNADARQREYEQKKLKVCSQCQ